MCEWALALGLCLRTTQEHFGARDGRPRDSAGVLIPTTASAAVVPPAAEVVDLSAAMRASVEGLEGVGPMSSSLASPPAAATQSPRGVRREQTHA